MPLVKYSLEIVKQLLQELGTNPASTRKVMTFSTPDLVVSARDLLDTFGDVARGIPTRSDQAQIIAWHKASELTSEIFDTSALFQALGYHLDAVDIVAGRGGEMIYDLNEALPATLHNQYDIVYDCISNQCFNIAQCMDNAVRCCRPGGYIFHTIPMTMINQGFWNANPTAYHDFYAANHFELLKYEAVVGVYRQQGTVDFHPVKRARGAADDIINVVVAQKPATLLPVVWPVMSKFQASPTCKR